MATTSSFPLLFFVVVVLLHPACSAYVCPPPRDRLAPLKTCLASVTTPQQVHISVVGTDMMRITWITEGDALPVVDYGTAPGEYTASAKGTTSSYRYVVYRSGSIHEAVIGPLKPATTYYYRLSQDPVRELSLRTPPAELPVRFVVAGDLGQTEWTKTTLVHIGDYPHNMLLLPGDLSYADTNQPLWDTFGRLVEPLASSRPWMVTEGNHEIETIFLIETRAFKAYNARWRMPIEPSNSPSNLLHSFDVAGVHVLMLGSYADYTVGSDQYRWLVQDLAGVDRGRTPWVVALLHAPWYNSNDAHQGEGEAMRLAMEAVLYKARVDIIFAGHVHAYERFDRVFDNKVDKCGAVHITVGDGGNKEGLASSYKDPKPDISVFREASFGHGRLEVVNRTHAHWSWQRNDDDVPTVSDSAGFISLPSVAACHG